MNRLPVVALVVYWMFVPALMATEPLHWTLSTPRDFLEGKLRGVSISSDGRLVLAPDLKMLLDTEEAFIFDMTADARGNIYLATGNNGKIYRWGSDGTGSEWAKLNEPGVYALAVDSSNRVYAGTGPDGKVYRLSPSGEPETFFDPGEKYIWALAIDAQNNVFVATGPKGIIYKVDQEKQQSTFFDSTEAHIVTLESDSQGNLLAGSSPQGLVYRLTPEGRSSVLYDSPLQEIKAITVDRYGNVYAAALGGTEGSESPSITIASTMIKKDEEGDSPEGGNTVSVSGIEKGKKMEVYKIDKANTVELIHSSNDQLAFDLSARPDGSLLVGTGGKGRIVSIDPQKFLTHLVESPDEQITELMELSGSVFAATSNLGKLYQLQTRPTNPGVYESKALDARVFSSWGNLRWFVRNPTGAAVKLFTRSGNTATPDQTWSAWAGPLEQPSGSAVQSPPARYFQWKAEFAVEGRPEAVLSDQNALEFVSLSYLQKNVAPKMVSLTVHQPGLAFMQYPNANPSGGVSPGGPDGAHLRSLPRYIRELDTPGSTPPPRRIFLPGARSFSWDAQDANGDDLIYTVYYRTQEDTAWRLLKSDLTDNQLTIDGLSFPDGTYHVRVHCSDRLSNPKDQALESQLTSKAFVIANGSPRIEVSQPQVQEGRVTVPFTVQTGGASSIHQAEYSVNSGEWNILFPQDGIADSRSESYTISTEKLGSGSHVISVRATDSVGNLSTARTTVSVP